jgi:hypothetical protein
MNRSRFSAASLFRASLFVTAVLVALSASVPGAFAQNCPKVVYSTPNVTMKNLVAAVNCLNANGAAEAPAAKPVSAKGSMQVDSFQIVGPQHSRPYSSVVLAVLSVPTGAGTKTAVVTPDTHEATITAEAGGTCSVKINADKTVDSRCYIAGGTVYVVYR